MVSVIVRISLRLTLTLTLNSDYTTGTLLISQLYCNIHYVHSVDSRPRIQQSTFASPPSRLMPSVHRSVLRACSGCPVSAVWLTFTRCSSSFFLRNSSSAFLRSSFSCHNTLELALLC